MRRRAAGIVAWLATCCLAGMAAHAGDVESYLTGEMAKLELLEKPVSLVDHQITYADGSSRALRDKHGEIVAVREGFLQWDVPEARALITALMDGDPEG